ncbi:uncharacterized protein A1O9_11518 [Exophiala aquamarina CBS 119918]|uniref:Uncharacterized protein n=1 Tax=Exophiala aquamarina CBS 119918 TaxID=1182545 RepID=A0A072NZ58_9EURO|nr:uncharacterized protein A1O9_11518 [Exophiala aquamarina CBS 119918]KEF52278.1 hypothetical protein A1O9_11518 [Exophiala aquamarina CBS 119918]
MTSPGDSSSGPSISPALIVGIVILCAFVAITIAASIFRFCRQKNSRDGGNAPFDEDLSEVDLFNPNIVRPASQVARMREVRWINNMYAWERGRQAKREVGELRPTTMFAANRKGEARNWDEWSVWENRESMANPTGEHSGATYFYNVDDPYAPSSQQRLSQAASVLLPPHPANPNPNNQGWRDSRLRHSFAPGAGGDATASAPRSQEHDGRGAESKQQQREGDEEMAKTDVAVVDDGNGSPTPKGKGHIHTHNDIMEDLAAGLGGGLGLGPRSGSGSGSGYQAEAQQASRENGSEPQQQAHNSSHHLSLQPSRKNVKGKNRASAPPPVSSTSNSKFLSPPLVRR